MQNRRQFIRQVATAAGGLMLFPLVTSCGPSRPVSVYNQIPFTRPPDWDPIAFNRKRGNAGAIPESYLDDINGPDGETKHLGKHLPYIPGVDTSRMPNRYLPLMWGDPDKGYVRHPNAVPNESNNHEGHWFNWIRIRKATNFWGNTAESTYAGWPVAKPPSTGKFAPFEGNDVTDDKGKNTIYLALLPSDVKKGDTIRIWGHCLTHGEYIDFLTL